jgi:hypothetical protein
MSQQRPTQLSVRSTRRCISPDYGLFRVLLKLLPLSKGFSPVFLERIDRLISKKKKSIGIENPSISASDSFATQGRLVAGGRSVTPSKDISLAPESAGHAGQYRIVAGKGLSKPVS